MLKKSKRFLTAVISVITALAMSMTAFAAITYGDVDNSGDINVTDARLVLRFAVKLETPANDDIAKAADVDGDGDIDVSDARLVLRVAVKLDTSFPAHDHVYGDFVTVKEPTCTEKGLKEKSCTICGGETIQEEIKALGHTVVTDKAVAATCTKTGLTEGSHCSVCNTVIKKQETVNALGHTVVTDKAVAATCTKTGLTEGSHCSVCKTVIKKQETVAALNHKWNNGEITTAATCTKEGVKTYTCTLCKATKNESIAKTAHSYDSGKITTAATCTKEGIKTYTCTVCKAKKTESVPALGHNIVKHTAKAPTCTEKGWNAYETCSHCNYTTYVEKAALGHTYGNYVKGANNTHTRTCSVCGNKETKNCTFTSVVTKPTCTEKGYTTYTCSVCGNSYKDNETKATGHKYTAVVTAPTCTEKGYTTHTCSVCGDSYKDTETNALGHDFSTEWTTDTEATCTTAGSKSHHCSRCSEKSDVTTIDALGHDFSTEWTVDVAKTCTTAGSKSHHCTRCDAKADVTVIEAGHDYSVDNSIFPKTQEEAGEGNLYINESPVCRLCGWVPKTATNVEVFNNMVNIIKNNFNYRSSHNIKRIIKESETTNGSNIEFDAMQALVEDQIKSDFGTETTYRYTDKISKIASATSLPYLQYTVSNLQKDDISGFTLRVQDGLKASDVLTEFPDTITVGSNTKDLTSDKNKSWSGKVIKIGVTIKNQVFTVNGSSDKKHELWDLYRNDNAYECAMSKITTEINPIRDAQAYNMDEKGNVVRDNYTISENEESMEMSMTLKSVKASGTVTYYFNADTFEPLMAQYNLSETLIQNIKMSFDGVVKVKGSMTATVTNNINQVYFFNENSTD